MTFVDYAELVWKRLDSGETQKAAAEAIGWSREAVKDYAALQRIDADAWAMVGASFSETAPTDENEAAPSNGAVAPFTARLLREILDLCPCQQVELCKTLAKGKNRKGHKFTKADFKVLAKRYKARIDSID